MNEQNVVWLQLLESAQLDPNSELANGLVLQVIRSENWDSLCIYVELEHPIPFQLIQLVIERIRGFLVDENIKQVNFHWSYRNQSQSDKLIKEYFDAAIAHNYQTRKLPTVLRAYHTVITQNKIEVLVATENDEKIAEEALELIREFFIDFGLDYVEMKVTISSTEECLRDHHQRQVALRDEQKETREMELYKQRLSQERVEANPVVYKPKPSKFGITCKIKDLPTISMDVYEFNQKNSNANVVVQGTIFSAEIKNPKNYFLFEGIITDYEDSIMVKQFFKEPERKFFDSMKPGRNVQIEGKVQYDTFARDVVIMASKITLNGEDATKKRFDEAKEKRVELHAHTKMSTLDSVLDVEKYVDLAKQFNHTSLAVTDHANCHVLPEFFSLAKKNGIKPIAGVEGYFVDENDYRIALTNHQVELQNQTYVVFDIETTGFSVNFHEIIEIGAVKIKNGFTLETFSTFVRPNRPISAKITEITSITNDDVAKAPLLEEVLPKFVEFCQDSILVAHNATFDTSHIYHQMKRLGIYQEDFPCIDTLQLARVLYHERIKRFNLEAVAKELKVELEHHHRAISDARTTTNIFMKMLGDLSDLGITKYQDINSLVDDTTAYKYVIPNHIQILVKNKVGLKNFYKIISDSHTTHFYKEPRVLKSVLEKYREGLLIGSGCVHGDIFINAFEKSYEDLLECAKFYDYLEVQPPECYCQLVEESGEEITKEHIKTTIETIIKVGKELGIPVVATGDVHQLDEADTVFRKIYARIARPGGGLHDLFTIENVPAQYFRTTSEMLDSFSFLPPEIAYEIVVKNTNEIANLIEEFPLFPKQLFTPRDDFMSKYGVPSMAEAVRNLTYEHAISIYGQIDPSDKNRKVLPTYIQNRIEQELSSIIGNGYASIYYISHMLVKNSLENGYIVGSRGSVGSSFVATMMRITEVNPLKPHYVCPSCHFSAFKPLYGEDESEEFSSLPLDAQRALRTQASGQDLPYCDCPRCGTPLNRDGVDIPFETFLGIPGEKSKIPDIDLNFSGDYQERAHLFCREIFGIDNSFRAGTIGTVAEKTAYGFVRGFLEGKNVREAEVKRLSQSLIGAKRTTGQHPGGIVIVPDTIKYTDIIPVQYPADDVTSTWRTSHYDYHSFEDNLLKMDILGHDDPTVIRHLMDFVKQYPNDFPFSRVEDIPMVDEKVISLFSSKQALNIRGNDDDPLPSGTIGIPEFGTNFVRDMLRDIAPKTFSEIVKVSGLSHGTDVWAGNAKNIFLGLESEYEKISFNEVIACRDDIMIYLLSKKLNPKDAFSIMERVRKGKGLTPEEERLMLQHQVPQWYIDSCQKIKYMFPKAHAVAYVIMALRIGWFKVHRPIYYYAAYFSRRARAFDVEVFASGKNAIRNKMHELMQKVENRTASNKEVDLLGELQIALEMTLRGFEFKMVDINHSESRDFVLSDDHQALYLPFCAVDSLGEAAAISIVEARNVHPFTSKKDLLDRTKLNRTVFNRLKVMGVLDSLPDEEVNRLL